MGARARALGGAANRRGTHVLTGEGEGGERTGAGQARAAVLARAPLRGLSHLSWRRTPSTPDRETAHQLHHTTIGEPLGDGAKEREPNEGALKEGRLKEGAPQWQCFCCAERGREAGSLHPHGIRASRSGNSKARMAACSCLQTRTCRSCVGSILVKSVSRTTMSR